MTVEVDRNYLAMLEKAYEEYKILTEPKEKQTNFEKIHIMSPDELAEFLGDTGICKMCIYGEHGCGKDIRMTCKKGIKKWLYKEAENE